MFKNIQIVSRSNNRLDFPNQTWTTKSRIVCLCELELGLGEKITFDLTTAPRLELIIQIYLALKKLNTATRIYKLDRYELCIDRQNNKTEIIIRESYSKRILLQKNGYYFLPALIRFQQIVIDQLFPFTNKTVRRHYGQLLFGDYNKSDPFSIGTKVKAIRSDNVTTPRVGFVIAQGYSKDWDGSYYALYTDQQFYTKRYRKEDLISLD